MKLHPIFGVNAVPSVCPCCKSIIGYLPQGDRYSENVTTKFSINKSICLNCVKQLEDSSVFISCEIDNKGQIIAIDDSIFIRNEGLSQFFKDISNVNIVNYVPVNEFKEVFKDIIENYNKNKENEDNKTKC